tara:strand:- start:197 stop:466 length:270 start_codon:yes stop_codon:yes gene_type:complete
MKKLTTKKLIQYMQDRTDEPLRHDAESLASACNTVSAEFNHDNALDMLKLLCFNDAIHGLHTHSYSFQTATGREIIHKIQQEYYEYKDC